MNFIYIICIALITASFAQSEVISGPDAKSHYELAPHKTLNIFKKDGSENLYWEIEWGHDTGTSTITSGVEIQPKADYLFEWNEKTNSFCFWSKKRNNYFNIQNFGFSYMLVLSRAELKATGASV